MPWPKTSVPKFGSWEKSEDLSYSIVFDKARAEKEQFLHASDNDVSPDQGHYKSSREDAVRKTLVSDKARADKERFHPTSEQVKKFTHTNQNFLRNPEAIAGRGASHAPSYSASIPHGVSSRSPRQNRARKGSTFPDERQHIDHARLHAKSTNVPGRSIYAQNPPIAKTRSSQAGLEAARIADMQRKHVVPKFGDWESEDAFTAAFNTARNEKNSKNALHPNVAVSPSQPDEDLYKSSEFSEGSMRHKNRRGWYHMFCCSGGAAH